MSVNWDLTKIDNSLSVCWEPIDHINQNGGMVTMRENEQLYRQRPITWAIIWMMIHCDAGREITKQNVEELYIRIKLWEALFGTLLRDGMGDGIPITPGMLHEHIGLIVNANKTTWAQFRNRVTDSYRADSKRDYAKIAIDY